jgi:hypothetical protein
MILGVPEIVAQAMDDTSLPAAARVLMWELRTRLDFLEYREQKQESLACSTRMKRQRVGLMLDLLVARGYLDSRPIERRRVAYRLYASRRPTMAVEMGQKAA